VSDGGTLEPFGEHLHFLFFTFPLGQQGHFPHAGETPAPQGFSSLSPNETKIFARNEKMIKFQEGQKFIRRSRFRL
jgi:hypothetical protein